MISQECFMNFSDVEGEAILSFYLSVEALLPPLIASFTPFPRRIPHALLDVDEKVLYSTAERIGDTRLAVARPVRFY